MSKKATPSTFNPTPVEAFKEIRWKIDGCGDPTCMSCPRTKIAIAVIDDTLGKFELYAAKVRCFDAVRAIETPHPAELSQQECIDLNARQHEEKFAAFKALEELEEKLRPKYDCSSCKDTRTMTLREQEVMCTRCPTPCQGCRASGNGPFCETTPCPCRCHLKNRT